MLSMFSPLPLPSAHFPVFNLVPPIVNPIGKGRGYKYINYRKKTGDTRDKETETKDKKRVIIDKQRRDAFAYATS